MVIPHIEIMDRHIQSLRLYIKTGMIAMFLLNAGIAAIFILSWASTRDLFERGQDINRVMSERLDRNYLVIKSLRDANITHCKVAHGIDLDLGGTRGGQPGNGQGNN